MPVKTVLILPLALLMAALPVLLSSCELHCLSASVPNIVHPSPASHCAGHAADRGTESASPKPSGNRHDCSGHAVLAKATALPGVLPAPAPAMIPAALMLSLSPSSDPARVPEAAFSPPPSRSPTILRL